MRLVFIALILTADAGSALATLNGFQKATWDTKRKQIKALFPTAKVSQREAEVEQSIASVPVKVNFSFDDQQKLKLVAISRARLNPGPMTDDEVCAALQKNLSEKYGPATLDESTEPALRLKWIGPKTLVWLVCDPKSIDTISLFYNRVDELPKGGL